jgi:hypothetical protein
MPARVAIFRSTGIMGDLMSISLIREFTVFSPWLEYFCATFTIVIADMQRFSMPSI